MERFRTFTVLITTINRSIHKIKTEEMAEFNLKSAHVNCLYYLGLKGDMTLTELSEMCEEDKGAVSRSLDYLEKEGMVTKKGEGRYKAALTLTGKGREISDSIQKKVDGVLSAVGKELSEEDRDQFYRCLMKIDANLQEFCKKYEK